MFRTVILALMVATVRADSDDTDACCCYSNPGEWVYSCVLTSYCAEHGDTCYDDSNCVDDSNYQNGVCSVPSCEDELATYETAYCDDGSVFVGTNCEDETCSTCEEYIDYTALSGGQYTCDVDTNYYYYDEDLDGTNEEEGVLPGCYYDDPCDPSDDSGGGCSNNNEWRSKGKASKDCDWVATKPHKFCEKSSGNGGPLALTECPEACGTCYCEDSTEWRYKGKSSKDCDYVSMKPNKRCKYEDLDGTSAADACQISCHTCGCTDSYSWRYQGKSNKDCEWVAEKPDKRCNKKDEDGTKAKNACKATCNNCD